MRKIFKNLFLIIIIPLLTSCGYSPLLNSQNINFDINNLSFEGGDRKVNNYITNNLKKHINSKGNVKSYDLKIISSYEKTITNKDKSGNPKNYNIKVKTNVAFILDGGNQTNKIFERNISLSSKEKKIDEGELEKK